MDENNVITATMVTADMNGDVTTIEAPVGAENAKTEPVKEEKADNVEIEKLKRLLSKANSEAASYKEQLRAKQTADERERAERAEKERADAERLAELERIVDISDTVKRSLAISIDADTSQKLAEAWNAHDKESMFNALKQFVEATNTRINNELLNRQPGLSAGTPPHKGNTDDELTAQLRRYAGLPVHR